MTRTEKHLISLLVAGAVLIGILLYQVFNDTPKALGSIDSESGYLSTSTRSMLNGTALPNSTVVKNGPGMLGSVVITGAAAGPMTFYNATTTDVNKRTGNNSTSTIMIATFPASTAAGTYTLDVTFTQGLIYEFSGTAPTSTITYR